MSAVSAILFFSLAISSSSSSLTSASYGASGSFFRAGEFALSILAFDGKPGEPAEELAFLKKTMAVGAGFDFSAGDLDGIWNEGTAQMALCCLKQGMNDEYHALLGYLKTQEYKDGGIPAADRDGVSTGFLLSGTQQLWEYNNTLSIGATGWYALAQLQADPLAH